MISIYYTNFHTLLMYGIIFWGGDNKSNSTYKLQMCVCVCVCVCIHRHTHTSHSGISKHTSRRQVFQDFNILPVVCIYIFEMWYYITDHKKSVVQNVKFHNYNNKKCILHVPFCNKQSVGNTCMGIRLYNNMPDHI